mmetsp:Transcript_20267/g.56201  ORF Transcript_20267/g.56201 Transcript_20267/m.56201 type:complete len:281 (-) Transcript_20267:360-1202(-)|eukprot:CAMPEP_0117668796 /NCGR_PEP_ID=MMETSP0804-20121206/11758_1 /TAXON_ID=1074897 /ORGANISM="Tetraselmis astigmatica, Strain CCMP880" /LENGTH=280 /DNA_ID=CAMNT_0005476747 /DNA_START=253 /DNA_END=1095 /DNA_ORIENTATION=+
MGGEDKLLKPVKDPILAGVRWVKQRNPKEKTALGAAAGIALLFLLWLVIEDHDNLFIMSEVVHFLGIAILIYKLQTRKNCAGLSLRTQELTALFLAVRLYCSFMMEYDIHTLLDLLTLAASLYAIYIVRFPLKATYQADLDSINILYVVGPCVILAFIAKPGTNHFILHRVLWALCVYLEAVSVFPQLRMMQNSKVVERFTAHYVFALGFSRFLSCAHWVLQIIDGDSFLLTAFWRGLWPVMVLLSEIVQTFILADFCYYYIKSYVTDGTGVVRLPSGIV